MQNLQKMEKTQDKTLLFSGLILEPSDKNNMVNG